MKHLLPLTVALLALLLVPRASNGYSTIGGSLALTQRDVRVFDNFTSSYASDNVTPHASFPGATGAELAIWKASVEWGSELHGDGQGDPHQLGGLGSGAANFDPTWQGNATGTGKRNDNIHSEIAGPGGGVLAYCETPISDGWRIRYYSDRVWDDGPDVGIGLRYDLQGVATHEYGHALGLGHSTQFGATMYATISGSGASQRSIEADDIAGLQSIYGARDSSKPRITWATVDTATATLTITGTGFATTGNEVWFTQAAAGGNGQPVKASGLSSAGGGTSITLAFPVGAGPGDVLVKVAGSGHGSLSNAWPVDPALPGTPFGPPVITGMSPQTVTALAPGAVQVTVTGARLDGVSSLTIDGVLLPSGDVTLIDDTQLAFLVPRASRLGSVPVVATGLFGASQPGALSVVADDPPAIELEDLVLLSSAGIVLRVGGAPGDLAFVVGSPDRVPSVAPGLVSLAIGNQFQSLVLLSTTTVPSAGWFELRVPVSGLPLGTPLHFQAATLDPGTGALLLSASGVADGTFLF